MAELIEKKKGGGPQFLSVVACAVGAALFIFGNLYFSRQPPRAEALMSVALPVPLQLLYAGGDRYLAANVGTWRAIMVGTVKLPHDTLKVLARVQGDVSWLNPGQEDNYYTATAILPWEGELDATQEILERATKARPTDVYPPFYLGFNKLHFHGDVQGAVEALVLAASHAQDEGTRQALTVMAARWSEKSDETEIAIQMVRLMAEGSKDRALKDYLKLREQRLQGLKSLRDAYKRFTESHGAPPASFGEMVSGGAIDRLPVDPLDGGYVLKDGSVFLMPAKR